MLDSDWSEAVEFSVASVQVGRAARQITGLYLYASSIVIVIV